ncbi:MAG TPA: pyridoxal kinase PdxY [Kaistiaceae bacterium]|nr:pyridoxal kinase PdxY [Kaistiaceae bacterium]
MSRPAVVVVSSHVARGGVGLRAAGFALARLGFPVWEVPTVLLPFHPGHGRATRVVPGAAEFAAMLDDLAASRWLGEVGAVLSGYLGEASQAEAIAGFVARVKAANPEALYCCDPVIGDDGGLYVPQATMAAIRDRLLPIADIATPNRFELEFLAGAACPDNGALVAAAEALGPARVLVSSAHAMMRGAMATLLVGEGGPIVAEHQAVANAPHGPGDLMAALFLGARLAGADGEKALARTTASVFEMVVRSARAGSDELLLAAEQMVLDRPSAMTSIRRLAVARPRPR